jgi:hypothetical protein
VHAPFYWDLATAMAVTLFGGLLHILRISNPLASNPSYHKVEWIDQVAINLDFAH